MQQRRLRLGDILDDYCPRERRITNHVIVAMIDEDVRQTRCTTCDAEHEYKQGKAPASRRKKTSALSHEGAEETRPRAVAAIDAAASARVPDQSPTEIDTHAETELAAADLLAADAARPADVDAEAEPDDARLEDDGPVHRRLIRATLPRPEGHVPERKEPDFTMRQAGREANGNRHGQRSRGQRGVARQAQGHQGGQNRFGGQRPGAGTRHGSGAAQGPGHGQGQRQGNRPGGGGQPSSHRGSGGGAPGGQNRGPGRKRGR
jgi:hypothetical protein